MLWGMEHGDRYQALMRQCDQDGSDYPDFILNRPQLLPGLNLFYEAFIDLGSCRSIGMGPGPIPYTAILAYADYNHFDDEIKDDLMTHLAAMDSAFLARVRANQERK